MEGGVAAIFEFGEQTAVQKHTQQYKYTAPTYPGWYPPGNMGLAFADVSFLDWVGFLRRRVLKLGSLS